MEEQTASEHLLSLLRCAATSFPDDRAVNSRYSMSDIVMSAFSVFHMQSPSFLHHQTNMRETLGSDNARTLYGIENIPGDDQTRNVLDKISPEHLHGVYRQSLDYLAARGELDNFKVLDGKLLCAFDGTEYFRSDKIHCKHCGSRKRDGTVQYYHRVVNPVIVHPERKFALPLILRVCYAAGRRHETGL